METDDECRQYGKVSGGTEFRLWDIFWKIFLSRDNIMVNKVYREALKIFRQELNAGQLKKTNRKANTILKNMEK